MFALSLTPAPLFSASHENWVMLEAHDLSMSAGASHYHPCVVGTQGLLYTCTWRAMETALDVYNFSPLLTTINYAHGLGKKVIIRVFYKSYSGAQPKPLPAYILDDPATYGGAATSGGLRNNSFSGWTPRFDNAALMERFKALITAMASAVGGHEALQGVGPDESAWSFGSLWGTATTSGLTAAQVRQVHRDKCLHFQSCFPGKEIYPFYNFCDGSTDAEIVAELEWSISQGMCAGITDTHRVPEQSSGLQPVEASYPVSAKTLMCVDYLSTGADDSGLTERYLENARTTAARGASITAWYTRGGAPGNYWAAIQNAISTLG